MIAKPQLGFSEAVKLAFGKITQMSGRSRRSEFWWFMLVYVIGYWVLSTIAAFVLPVVEAQIAVGLIMLVALPATARRLHDLRTWLMVGHRQLGAEHWVEHLYDYQRFSRGNTEYQRRPFQGHREYEPAFVRHSIFGISRHLVCHIHLLPARQRPISQQIW